MYGRTSGIAGKRRFRGGWVLNGFRWGWRAAGFASLGLIPMAGALWSQAATLAPQNPSKKAKLAYNQDIRPILAENCFPCHGPDSAARKADLRLDRPEEAAANRSGRFPLKKGDPANSEVFKRITGRGPIMPPPSSHKKLTPSQIATLKQWIFEGASYERHWSLIPPVRPELPAVKDTKWVRNPVDRFILAKLEAAGLKPNPEADRRTLARRLSLDLVGLPPDAAEVEEFVNDKSPDYFEKYVDRLMAKPQWGEHRGRYWLDAARYADTHGIHFDNYREMWSYRDWVINAFNRNLPFDQFTIEQLAGDLLPNPTLDQLVATGFNRCNITTNEGGAIDDEYIVLYARDRTETVGWTFLGTTMNCAVCHDHKFDPIAMRDFYSLSAYFNNSTQRAMDGNVKDTPPIIPVPLLQDRPRWDAIQGELKTVRAKADERKAAARPEFEKWLAGADTARIVEGIPADGLRLHLPLNEGSGVAVKGTMDGQPLNVNASKEPLWDVGYVAEKSFQRKGGSVVEIPAAGDFEKDQGFSYSAWIKIARGDRSGAIISRMDDKKDFRGWDLWLENGKVGTHIVSKWPEDALKVMGRESIPVGQWRHVTVTYDGGGKAESVRVYVNGNSGDNDVPANSLKSSIKAEVPFKVGQRSSTSPVDGVSIQDVRLYGRALTPAEVKSLAAGTRAAYLASRGTEKLAVAEKDELFGWWLPGQDAEFKSLAGAIEKLQDDERAIKVRGTVAHIWNEKPGEPSAYMLKRGEYDKRGDPVKAATPAALHEMPADLPKNRLGLAKWLLMPENPLTARVTVNRYWQELFGQGLVRTPSDFGVTGDLPSHPELLDWLALEFRNPTADVENRKPKIENWDIKRFFKFLVTSAAYRQSAAVTPEKKLKDRENRLLSRGPRFRMDAEMIRDYALAASGLLVRKLGGPSVRPYQPEGVWEAVAMPESNTRNYKQDTGEALYRRSMYTLWKRAAPPASMDIFNAPAREVCTVRRERTNTPLQALVTLNDVQFVEAARNLAQNALKNGGDSAESRLNYISERLISRGFRPAEQRVITRNLAKLETLYKANPEEAKKLITYGESKPDPTIAPDQLAAWTMLTNQLMNLDEVLNK